ncbi:helix-turn-helix domain-containing protein [Streptomyces cinerochromogenes]|uniref:PucR family transcriptional regulator n=1 Tax=Streptomyces cinerochromogenes TaxID=66422 RepID=UPI001671644E|nr:helix-turn-helix domain-containing protein [Streptomyces cinerochromogenes]
MSMQVPDEVFTRRPWHELPPALAVVLRPRMDAIATDMIGVIRDEVPAYRRPLDSALGRDLAGSVRRAIGQFVELTEEPHSRQEHHVRHFRTLGRLEFLNGRTTDALQAAFRVGARVGARLYAETARSASLPLEVVMPLHEAVLTHINVLSNESVKGYAAAQALAEGGLQRSRRTLAACLLDQQRAARRDVVESLARQAQWPLPDAVACLLVRQGAGGGRLSGPGQEGGADVLALTHGADLVLIVPAPESNGTVERLRTAVRGRTAALGPAVPPRDAWVSLHCARLMLAGHAVTAAGDGTAGGAFVRAGDGLAEAHLRHGIHIGRLLGDRTLGVLRDLPPGRAARLAETLDALLMSWSRTAPEVARALGIHPQTARKRLRRLEELFGDRLSDPAFRFEALLALRTRALTAPRA